MTKMSWLTWISSQLMKILQKICLQTNQKLKSTAWLQLNILKFSRICWLPAMFLKRKINRKNKINKNKRMNKTKMTKNKSKLNRVYNSKRNMLRLNSMTSTSIRLSVLTVLKPNLIIQLKNVWLERLSRLQLMEGGLKIWKKLKELWFSRSIFPTAVHSKNGFVRVESLELRWSRWALLVSKSKDLSWLTWLRLHSKVFRTSFHLSNLNAGQS